MPKRYPLIDNVCFTRIWPGLLLGTLACGILIATSIAPASLAAQDRPGANIFSPRNGIPEAVAVYKGRRVAMPMHYKGAEW